MDKGLGPPPKPSRRANGQGLQAPPPTLGGPATLHDLGAASKWTRVGADKGWGSPHPAFANGQGLGPNPSRLRPQPCTTCRWTRVGGPNPSRLANGQGLGAPQPRLAHLKFCLDKHGPPNHRTLEHISQGTGSVSTDRNINDKPFVPECTLEQILHFA